MHVGYGQTRTGSWNLAIANINYQPRHVFHMNNKGNLSKSWSRCKRKDNFAIRKICNWPGCRHRTLSPCSSEHCPKITCIDHSRELCTKCIPLVKNNFFPLGRPFKIKGYCHVCPKGWNSQTTAACYNLECQRQSQGSKLIETYPSNILYFSSKSM